MPKMSYFVNPSELFLLFIHFLYFYNKITTYRVTARPIVSGSCRLWEFIICELLLIGCRTVERRGEGGQMDVDKNKEIGGKN